MPDKSANAEAPLEEQLVAYLDGELDAESSQRIEELLANDPEVRQTLQRLDRTWEMLDELDQPDVADRFTQSTLEMVVVAATKDMEEARAKAPRQRRRRWALRVAGLLVVGLFGFAVVARVVPDRNQQLIRDLPILENLDQYRQIKDIEFLRMLDDQAVFADRADSELDPAEDPVAARQQIEQLSEAEKGQLLRRSERFTALSPAEQQRIRQLHEQLEHAPDGERLRRVLGR